MYKYINRILLSTFYFNNYLQWRHVHILWLHAATCGGESVYLFEFQLLNWPATNTTVQHTFIHTRVCNVRKNEYTKVMHSLIHVNFAWRIQTSTREWWIVRRYCQRFKILEHNQQQICIYGLEFFIHLSFNNELCVTHLNKCVMMWSVI